jgi:peptidoglycan/LPS O-acetylase OafA/YrhL
MSRRGDVVSSSAVLGFKPFQKRPYFAALDGLRALSILLVLLHHAPELPRKDFFWTLQENGRYGVGFFFVISGFLICTLFLREESRFGRVNLWKFYGRRALRLLPLYYAVLLVQALLVFGLHQYTPENQQLFREKLPSYLLYYSDWLPTMTQGPFFCAWSLAIEEQFYIGFGLLLFLCSRRTVIAIVSIALLVKIAVYQLFGAVDAHSQVWLVLFSYREPILLGVLAAFALNSKAGYSLFKNWLRAGWLTASFGVGSVLWLSLHTMRQENAWDAQLLYLAMTLFLIGLVMRADSPVLGGRLLAHVGKVSYGIYLLHMFIFSTVKKLPEGREPWFSFLATAVLTILLASAVYQCFEQPIIRFYKRRFSPESGRSRAVSSLEPDLVGVSAESEVAGVLRGS